MIADEGQAQRIAVVTGGARGLGAAMVGGLLEAGHSVAAFDVDAPALAVLAERQPPGHRDRLLSVTADMADENSLIDGVARTVQRFGRIDVLVNNAGLGMGAVTPNFISQPVKFWEVEPATWRRFLDVNVTGAFVLARAVAPAMVTRGFGRIVSVTTSLGSMINPGTTGYGSSKAALESLTATMAEDLRGTGVTANVLTPGGMVDTPMARATSAGIDPSKLLRPSIMAAPLVWLCSDAADGVTARRYLAVHWDTRLPDAQAAEQAGAPIAWSQIAQQPLLPAS